jgi:hypothetical protein
VIADAGLDASVQFAGDALHARSVAIGGENEKTGRCLGELRRNQRQVVLERGARDVQREKPGAGGVRMSRHCEREGHDEHGPQYPTVAHQRPSMMGIA